MMKSQLVDILFCCDTNGLWKYLVLLSTSTLSNNQISSWCLLGLDDDKLSTNCSCWLSAILLMITLPILGYSFTVILTFHFPPNLRSFMFLYLSWMFILPAVCHRSPSASMPFEPLDYQPQEKHQERSMLDHLKHHSW